MYICVEWGGGQIVNVSLEHKKFVCGYLQGLVNSHLSHNVNMMTKVDERANCIKIATSFYL